MKRILSTLNVFLKQEIISLVVYSIATVLIIVITFEMKPLTNGTGIKEPVRASLIIISMASVFVGLYIGGGFLRLRQSHLWFTHKHYRMNLIYSLISGALIYGVIQFFALYHAGWSLAVCLIAPACITILTAQLIIASNTVMKFIFPAMPFILLQLTSYEISINSILLLLLVFTGLALYLNANNSSKSLNDNLGLMSGNIRQQLKAPSMQKLNKLSINIMRIFKVKPRKGDLSEALLQPSNRYGISSVLIALTCLVFIFLIDSKKLEIEVFGVMILGSMMLNQFMDVQLLSRQPKPFAHLFSGKNHALFKRNTLSMLDKHVTIQAILTILSLLLIGLFVESFVKSLILIKLGITIILIARAFAPLMLCLNWFNINIKLIFVVGLYALTSIIFCRWLLLNNINEMYGLVVLGGLTLLVLLRAGSVYFWKRQPIEKFMQVYG